MHALIVSFENLIRRVNGISKQIYQILYSLIHWGPKPLILIPDDSLVIGGLKILPHMGCRQYMYITKLIHL